MKLFRNPIYSTAIASYVGLFSIMYGCYLMMMSTSPAWLLLSLLSFFLLCIGMTVGYHRLFCHGSFKTKQFFHVILAYLGAMALYGSSIQWCGMHAAHHKHSDTPKDPHNVKLTFLLWKKNNPTPIDFSNSRLIARLAKSKLHNFIHNYYLLIIFTSILGFFLIHPHFLIFGYLIPLGVHHVIAAIHQVFAHDKSGPLDQNYLEFVLPLAGEWIHKHHHNFPGNKKFGKYDLGYRVIRLIEEK